MRSSYTRRKYYPRYPLSRVLHGPLPAPRLPLRRPVEIRIAKVAHPRPPRHSPSPPHSVTTPQMTWARPRVGLLGNPSDGYGGKVIAFTFEDFAARVRIEDAEHVAVVSPSGATREEESLAALATLTCDDRRAGDGTELPRAALARFLRHCEGTRVGPAVLAPDSPLRRFRLSFTTDIPRQVGLAGSSAIVTATLRALALRFAAPLPPALLAELALAAETEELGIAAGPQDRVVQAHGGLLHMDFAAPRSAASPTRLDPRLLPPLFVAWSPAPGAPSGDAHREVRRRFAAGDPAIVEALAVFATLADEGRAALEEGDHERLCNLVDRNFDTRAAIWPLRPEDRELVRIGRERGAAVKLAGSGGGVVGIPRDPASLPSLREAYLAAGHRWLRPRVTAIPPSPEPR